jgi:hypothetical protein
VKLPHSLCSDKNVDVCRVWEKKGKTNVLVGTSAKMCTQSVIKTETKKENTERMEEDLLEKTATKTKKDVLDGQNMGENIGRILFSL